MSKQGMVYNPTTGSYEKTPAEQRREVKAAGGGKTITTTQKALTSITDEAKKIKKSDGSSAIGTDGFIDPDVYKFLLTEWRAAGHSEATFNAGFSKYRNPDQNYTTTLGPKGDGKTTTPKSGSTSTRTL